MRTWLEIDLDRLKANYLEAKGMTQAKVTCVLKSNAYGHGSVQLAAALHDMGCRSFAVSCVREASELLRGGLEAEILIMGTAWQDEAEEILGSFPGAELIFTVADPDDVRALEAAAMGRKVACHIKTDTGFHRLGLPASPEAARELASVLASCPHVEARGLYSHLGLVTGERDEAQYRRLLAMRDYLRAFGVRGLEMHLCDSIGLVRYPAWHMDRVRIGAFLYGVRPSRTGHLPFACEPTLVFRTRVSRVEKVARGEVVGYSEKPLEKDTLIATLCAGYGDGYPRHLSEGRGSVLIHGVRCPVVGLVCMDQMMVDVSAVPGTAKGDTATLLGDGITYDEYAAWAETNRNECLSLLSARPVRVYLKDGRPWHISDELGGTR